MRNVSDRSQYNTYDVLFESKINRAIKLSDAAYSDMLYREVMKEGYYGLQVISDISTSRCNRPWT